MNGIIGALIILEKVRISPDAAFSVTDWTAYVVFIVVIGGIGTIEGPVVGAVIFYLLQRYLADFGASYLILLGTLELLSCCLRQKAYGALSLSATTLRSFRRGGGLLSRRGRKSYPNTRGNLGACGNSSTFSKK